MRIFLVIFSCLFFFKAECKPVNYKYQLAAAMIFQNEAEHLKEWIEYHKLVGIEHFYLFNNASTDSFMEVLEDYVAKGEVELYHYPQISSNQQEHTDTQCYAYNQALDLARGKAKWLAIIDADEYIVPLKTNSVVEALREFELYGGVYLNWLAFGTSHVEKIPTDQLMIEALTFCEKAPNSLGKSIVQPIRTKSNCTDPHRMWYIPPYYHVNMNHQKFDWICPVADDKMLIFHYYTGDLEHLVNIKYPRRSKWIPISLESYIQDLEKLNEIYNPTMLRFVPELRNRIR